MMQRYYQKFIISDLTKKMLFIGGPRQVGKTTLCKMIASLPQYQDKYQYLNWDNDEHRKIIINKQWHRDSKLIIFDELHKFHRWKQWIKGVYDCKEVGQQYLVTGSARMDVYKKGGDSLLGRYHYWRLHPLTIDEIPANITPQDALARLLNIGGFPEIFLLGDERETKRWKKERFNRIIREDIRDLSFVKNLKLLELFLDALRARAGQLVVLSNIATDLQISSSTAKNWLSLIEYMYIGFAIYPLVKNIPRSIQKPPKFYFYDNSDVENIYGTRLENLVATTLLKRLHFLEDYYGSDCKLHYIRDRDGREVDFVTIIDGVVEDLIEVKSKDSKISSALKYYKQKLNPKYTVQIVGQLQESFEQDGIIVANPIDFFTKIKPLHGALIGRHY